MLHQFILAESAFSSTIYSRTTTLLKLGYTWQPYQPSIDRSNVYFAILIIFTRHTDSWDTDHVNYESNYVIDYSYNTTVIVMGTEHRMYRITNFCQLLHYHITYISHDLMSFITSIFLCLTKTKCGANWVQNSREKLEPVRTLFSFKTIF